MSQLNRWNADRITAIILLALGLAITYGGWTMDRLEIRRIHPASIPGLLPIMLGIALMACAVILYVQAKNKTENDPKPPAGGVLSDGPGGPARLVLIIGIALVYALGLVGALPFWLATFLFVTGFICIFEFPAVIAAKPVARLLAIAAVEGALVAVAVSLLFEEAFLVRLP